MKTFYSKKKQNNNSKKKPPTSNEDLATKEDIFKNFEVQQKRIVFFSFYPWYFISNLAFPGRRFKHDLTKRSGYDLEI